MAQTPDQRTFSVGGFKWMPCDRQENIIIIIIQKYNGYILFITRVDGDSM